MTVQKKVRVALVGLGFGAEFVPIYLHHPDVASLTICDASEQIVNAVGDKFMIRQRSTDLKQILNSDEIDAVHLVTPIPLHAQQSLAVLEAGKHCACTVPMALDSRRPARDCRGAAQQRQSLHGHGDGGLYAALPVCSGDAAAAASLGASNSCAERIIRIWSTGRPTGWGCRRCTTARTQSRQFWRWPETRAKAVHCFGSGVMREELRQQYGNPYPIETAIFELESPTRLAAEVTRSLFHTARALCRDRSPSTAKGRL